MARIVSTEPDSCRIVQSVQMMVIDTSNDNIKLFQRPISKRKNIFVCLFSILNTISLSRHEQVCLMRLCFERHFFHHLIMGPIMREVSLKE